MKNFVLAVLTCAVLDGCTGADRLAPGQASIELNVHGGQYQQFETEYGDGTAEMTMRSANDDPKWAPMDGLCVRAAAGGDQVCLKFHVVNRGGDEIAAEKEVLSEDRKDLRSRERLEGVFHVGDTVRVGMLADGNKIKLTVNGAQSAVHTLPGPAKTVDLLCSTAACGMRLL